MKKGTVFEIMFVFIFGAIGWYLFGIVKHLELANPALEMIESYNNIMFSDGVGIDINGNKIESRNETPITTQFEESDNLSLERSDQRTGVAAFLLRYDTLDNDLMFWNEVKSNLSELDVVNVRLIAYCEDDRCIESIKKDPDKVHFNVLEYGVVVDMQAVIGADATGDFWWRGDSSKKINWRDEFRTPNDIVSNIGFGL